MPETTKVDRSGNGNGKKRVADIVIGLAKEAGLELFVTRMGDTYGRVQRNGHKEQYRINSRDFRNWLRELPR